MKVIIIGKGRGWEKAPRCLHPCKERDTEVWGVNNICLKRQVDLVFNIHNLEKHYDHKLFAKTITHVNKHKIPIVTQKRYEFIPTCIPFPLDEFYGRRYFTNSVDYMVAYACYKNRQRLSYDADLPIYTLELFGVVMETGTEYAVQRPSLEYWIGVFEGDGGEVIINEPTNVCKPPREGAYGFDWDEEDMPHVKARSENQ